MLQDLGLVSGLKSLCEDYGLACTLDLEDLNQIFGKETQISIYRVFQQGLDNVSRHAQASQVALMAKKSADRVDFLIEDNCLGFDVGQMADVESGRSGIGLAAMSERVLARAGTFKIESQAGVGTRIFFSIPKSRE